MPWRKDDEPMEILGPCAIELNLSGALKTG